MNDTARIRARVWWWWCLQLPVRVLSISERAKGGRGSKEGERGGGVEWVRYGKSVIGSDKKRELVMTRVGLVLIFDTFFLWLVGGNVGWATICFFFFWLIDAEKGENRRGMLLWCGVESREGFGSI